MSFFVDDVFVNCQLNCFHDYVDSATDPDGIVEWQKVLSKNRRVLL
jgi:hypothetical protein